MKRTSPSKPNLQRLGTGLRQLPEVLKTLGYANLRKGQDGCVMTTMKGMDLLALLPTAQGKCLAKGTPVLLFSGDVVPVEDIKVGDLLMGPDSKPRQVLTLARGRETMYEVVPDHGEPHTVNESHILSLRVTGVNGFSKDQIVDISVRDYLAAPEKFRRRTRLWRTGVDFPTGKSAPSTEDMYWVGVSLVGFNERTYVPNPCPIPRHLLTDSREQRLRLLAGLLDASSARGTADTIEFVSYTKPFVDDVLFLARSLGLGAVCHTPRSDRRLAEYRVVISGDLHLIPTVRVARKPQRSKRPVSALRTGFKLVKKPADDYYGFTIDGDRRFLLGDFTVTHNTATWLIPALCLKKRVLVFSPLIALIRDQVTGLQARGLSAVALAGDDEATNNLALWRWTDGQAQIMFSVPERIGTDTFEQAMKMMSPEMVVVDEAHTIAQWGDTFRTSFQRIGSFIERFPSIETVTAMTATARPSVKEKILDTLRIQPTTVAYLPPRENLRMSSSPFPMLAHDPKKPDEGRVLAELEKAIKERGKTLIYCATQKNVERLHSAMSAKMGSSYPGGAYHADLPPAYKDTTQHKFKIGEYKWIVATNAFGMGVDVPDIRNVYHYDQPGTVDACVQEWGRGGRDGEPTWCHSWYSEQARWLQGFFIKNTYPNSKDIGAFYEYVKRTADADGSMSGRTSEIAKALNCNDMMVSTMSRILEVKGCLTKTKIESDVVRIRWICESSDVDKSAGKKYDKYKACCIENGKHDGDCYSICLIAYSRAMKVGADTVHDNLREWSKLGLIAYEPPPKGNVYKVKKGLIGVDFSEYDRQRKENMQSLDTLMKLMETPDDAKPEFLQTYFQVSASGSAG